MELILLRHGTTRGNLERRYIGSGSDQPLCEEGRALAMRAKACYPPVERVFATPMKRTFETAAIVYPDLPIETAYGLQETHFGDYEGKTYNDLKDDPDYRRYVGGDPDLKCPGEGGESRREFAERCKAALETLVQQLLADGTQSAAIVIHGGTMMALLHTFVDSDKNFYEWMPKNLGGYRMKVHPSPLSLEILEEYRPE